MRRFFLLLVLLASTLMVFSQAKYIFYFIGDGMGANDVLLAEMYNAELKGKIERMPTRMSQFPYTGMATTYSASNSITDSSAAGTALATGTKTTNGTLGLDTDGKELVSIAEILKDKGWAVGVMSSVSIDHATPAAFYGNSAKRSNYYDIGTQLAMSSFDFFGGASFLQPVNKKDPSAPNLYKVCEEHGYAFAHGLTEFKELSQQAERIILIQPQEGVDPTQPSRGQIPYAIDRSEDDMSLVDITRSAIDFLAAKGNPFFMMVEGGAIDWANHSNDAATMLGELQEFDASIQQAYQFYRRHPKETLIIVTADHETGGLALGNSDYTLNLQLLQHQHISLGRLSGRIKDLQKEQGKKLKWDTVKELFRTSLGFYDQVSITPEEDAALQLAFKKMQKGKTTDVKTLYSDIDALAGMAVGMLNRKAKIGWTTYSHSAAAVPVYAIGVGAEAFTGWMDNTDIPMKILKATGIK